jgi:hypothetical protein
LTGNDICLGLGEARLDLLVIFVLSLFEGTLQIRCALLQGVYPVRNSPAAEGRDLPPG